MLLSQIGQAFDCLSLTLEMPFKDSADLPEPVQASRQRYIVWKKSVDLPPKPMQAGRFLCMT